MCQDDLPRTLNSLFEFWACRFDLPFIGAVAIGLALTVLFASVKFGEFAKRSGGSPFSESLRPAELTNPRAYRRAFGFYLLGLLFAYTMLCFIGPAPLQSVIEALPPPFDHPAMFPATAAVILLYVLPRAPYLSEVELTWRRIMHRKAQIPRAVLDLARTLRGGEFDRRKAAERIAASPGAMLTSAPDRLFRAEASPLEQRIARLVTLLALLSAARDGAFDARLIDSGFLERHDATFRDLRDRIIALVSGLPDEVSSSDEAADARLLAEVEELLKQACTMIASSAKAATGSAQARAVLLDELGFEDALAVDQVDESDLVVSAVVYAMLGYAVLVLLAPQARSWLPEAESGLRLGWPQPNVDIVGWLLPFLASQIAALGGAMMVRSHLAAGFGWYGGTMRRPQTPRERRYLQAGLVAYLMALVTAAAVNKALFGSNFLTELGAVWIIAAAPAISAVWFWRGVDAAAAGAVPRRRAWIAAAHMLLPAPVYYAGLVHFYREIGGMPGAVAFALIGLLVFTGVLALTVLFGVRGRLLLSSGLGDAAPA